MNSVEEVSKKINSVQEVSKQILTAVRRLKRMLVFASVASVEQCWSLNMLLNGVLSKNYEIEAKKMNSVGQCNLIIQGCIIK